MLELALVSLLAQSHADIDIVLSFFAASKDAYVCMSLIFKCI